MQDKTVKLTDLGRKDVPRELLPETYFDLDKYPFGHKDLFSGPKTNSVLSVLDRLSLYVKDWIFEYIHKKKRDPQVDHLRRLPGVKTLGKYEILVEPGVIFNPLTITGVLKGTPNRIYVAKGSVIFGAHIFLDEGDIYIGENTVLEPGSTIKGPAIIGNKCQLRTGTYLRGSVIVGNECIVRAELKNVVMLNKSTFPHISYLGDSICGYQSHFGSQVTAANFSIFAGFQDKEVRKSIVLKVKGKLYDTQRTKLGIILGDFCQVGCNSVTDPGTFLAPYTIVYSLSRIPKGFYGSHEIFKNKMFEKGVIERASLNLE